ncbi:MAG: CDP-alcohol phosphatidyltransferase family protein [Bradymonadia bacterium]
MLAEIRRIYRNSLKPADSLFNLYIARPLAAPWVWLFARTPITPNQVTLISMAVMVISALPLLLWPGPWGLALGVLLIEFSYILDCADGQLARLTGRTSEAGGLLDFLMDELKALLLVGTLCARWRLHEGGGEYALWVGLITLVIVPGALFITHFLRSPEYARATGTTPLKHGEAAGEASQRSGPLWPVKALARLVSQYPATLPIFAALGQMAIFVYAYAAVHALYVAQSVVTIIWKLGRPNAAQSPGEEPL